MNLNNLPTLRTFRKTLRSNLTPAEARLWSMLKNSQLESRKFRLGIELDGEVHFNEKAAEYDYERRLFLKYFGIRILRFENKYVFQEPETVLLTIKESFGWEKLEIGSWIED